MGYGVTDRYPLPASCQSGWPPRISFSTSL